MYFAMDWTSLSPRPEMVITMIWSLRIEGASLIAWATAWELSMAGIIPSTRVRYLNASTASSSVIG